MSYLPPKIIQSIQKDIIQIQKQKIEGIRIQEVTDITNIIAYIDGPVGTPFEGGTFTLSFEFGPEFPQKPPTGRFLTKIFHPNVSKSGEICVNALKKDWQPNFGIKHILMVIRCLLIAPNPASALNEEAGKLFQEDYSKYESKAKMFTSVYAMKRKDESKENVNSSNIKSKNDLKKKKKATLKRL